MDIKKALISSILLLSLVVGWTACGGGGTKPPVISDTVASIAITASSLAPAAGTTTQLSVTATYSSGSTAAVSDVTWSTSNNTVASVSAGGLVTTHAPGTAIITGQHSGVTSQITITVGAPVLAKLTLSTTTVSIAHGLTHTLEVTGQMTDGSAATGLTPTWTSSDTSVVTVANGVLTTHKPGNATITVTHETITATAQVTVLPAALTAIDVSPADSTIAVGAQQQFTATATYTDQSTANVTASATWTSSAPNFASIDTSVAGLVHGAAAGSSTISATLDSKTGSTTLTVSSAPSSAVTYLYTLGWSATEQTHYLKTLSVSDSGSMEETASIVVDPQSGAIASDRSKFIYVDADSAGVIKILRIDPTTGILTKTADFKPATGKLAYLTLDPTTKWLFGFDSTNTSAMTLRVFAIDQTTGALSDTGFSYPVGDFFLRPSSQNVTSFVTNASGTYFYWGGGTATCLEYGGTAPCRSLFGYKLDMATGELTALPGSPFVTWSPQVEATLTSEDGSTLWLSLDAFRVATYSLDPVTGVPTEVDRWFPFGQGMPIRHMILYGGLIYAGQDENLVRIVPPADNKLSSCTMIGYTLPQYIWDVAIGNQKFMFAAYTGAVGSFDIDTYGNTLPLHTFPLPLPQQIIAVDRLTKW